MIARARLTAAYLPAIGCRIDRTKLHFRVGCVSPIRKFPGQGEGRTYRRNLCRGKRWERSPEEYSKDFLADRDQVCLPNLLQLLQPALRAKDFVPHRLPNRLRFRAWYVCQAESPDRY